MQKKLWSGIDIAKATNGQSLTTDWSVTGLSIDSRTLKPGELFIALQGLVQDGHRFIPQAIAAGAGAILSQQPIDNPSVPVMYVANTLQALVKLGDAARNRSQATVVGVTGSVGKTSTKEMLRLVLSEDGQTHVSEASYNNHWGVPFSLAQLPPAAKFAVFEMGMNHAGEIDQLSNQVRPDIALITTIAEAHLAFFANVSEIADAKAEIFQGMKQGRSIAILPYDNSEYTRLFLHAQKNSVKHVISFGQKTGADIRLKKIQYLPSAIEIDMDYFERPVSYVLPVTGDHWAVNSLAVFGAAAALGITDQKIIQGLQKFTPPTGRGQKLHITLAINKRIILIDDSYNANPASMKAAFNVLQHSYTHTPGRRIAILGDMLELGDQSAMLHAELHQSILSNKIGLVFTCGPLMENLHQALPKEIRAQHYENSTLLADHLLSYIEDGDVILIKGSLGSRMKIIVNKLIESGKNYHAV